MQCCNYAVNISTNDDIQLYSYSYVAVLSSVVAIRVSGNFLRNEIHQNIESVLKSGNACYHSVQNLLSFSLLYKNLKIEIYRIIILPVVSYGCDTWSLTLREESRSRVFGNGVLRRVFGTKRNKVTKEWRKLHNEEFYDLYSPNIFRVINSSRMRVARTVESRSVDRVLVRKPEGKRPFRRPRRRWQDNIKMDLHEVGCGVMDRIELAHDRVR